MFLYNTKITSKHADFLASKLNKDVLNSQTEDELFYNTYNTLSRLYTSAYSPMMIRRYISGIPKLEDMNTTIEECICDIDSLNVEHENIATNLKTHFNERQNQKSSMISRIKALNNTIDDAMFINNQLTDNVIVFRDSFNNLDGIDSVNTEGLPAEVSTKEGVARLNVTSVENISKRVTLNKIDGQGEYGNVHMVDISVGASDSATTRYASASGNDPAALFDDNPNTYFEYSAVGVSDNDKKTAQYYDIDWAMAQKNIPLRMRMVLEVDTAEFINMINVLPFFNMNQTPRLKLISIRGSLNGIDYFSMFDGPVVINPNLNVLPDTYEAQNMYLKGSSLKLAGTGTFVFPPTFTKYLEFIFEQDQPYNVKVGHTYYLSQPSSTDSRYSSDSNVTPGATRLRNADVPKYIQDGDFTRYVVDSSNTVIQKDIEVFDGFKYSIGIKDIGIYKFEYASVSELLSVKYSTGDPDKKLGKPIAKVILETDELIPEEFTTKVSSRNSYIQYYVSFDDHNWVAISPTHRMPFGTESLPPKIIEINPVRASINSAVNASKYSYESAAPVYSFRLRAIFRRPESGIDNIKFFSPILEEYRVKVELQ